MKSIFALLSFLLALFLFPRLVFADAPVTQYRYSSSLSWENDPGTALNDYKAYWIGRKDSNGLTVSSFDLAPGYPASNYTIVYGFHYTNGQYIPSNYYGPVPIATQQGCANGGTPSGSPLSCPSLCTSGKTESFWTTTVVPTGYSLAANPVPAYPVSDGKCAVVVDSVGSCAVYGTTEECEFNAHQTGSALSVDPNWMQPTASPPSGSSVPVNTPPVKSSSCPGGTTQAGVDPSGIPVCYGSGTSPGPATTSTTTTPASSVTNSDGSTTATSTQTTTNSDGSVTTTTVVTNTATSGAVTVTKSVQTGPTPGGSPGSPDTPVSTPSGGSGGSGGSPASDPAQANLCKTNPNLNICRNSAVSGSCGSISCTGDAIQCATLRAAAAMQCQQKADSDAIAASPSTALGNSILAGSDPMQGAINTAMAGSTVDMSQANLDQSGFAGGASCFADKSFSVMGHNVVVSFATICSNIQPLRYAILACSFIVAYLVVAKSVLNG